MNLPLIPPQFQTAAWIFIGISIAISLFAQYMNHIAKKFQTCSSCRKVFPARARRCPACGRGATSREAE